MKRRMQIGPQRINWRKKRDVSSPRKFLSNSWNTPEIWILLINSLFSLFVQDVLPWFLPLGTKNVGVSQVFVHGPSSLIHCLFLLKWSSPNPQIKILFLFSQAPYLPSSLIYPTTYFTSSFEFVKDTSNTSCPPEFVNSSLSLKPFYSLVFSLSTNDTSIYHFSSHMLGIILVFLFLHSLHPLHQQVLSTPFTKDNLYMPLHLHHPTSKPSKINLLLFYLGHLSLLPCFLASPLPLVQPLYTATFILRAARIILSEHSVGYAIQPLKPSNGFPLHLGKKVS